VILQRNLQLLKEIIFLSFFLLSNIENLDYTVDSSLTLSPSQDESSTTNIPTIRSVDKPSTSLPNVITFSEDLIKASVGFRHIYSIKKYLPELYQNTVKLDSTPADAVLD
jgi:hypothetical protein